MSEYVKSQGARRVTALRYKSTDDLRTIVTRADKRAEAVIIESFQAHGRYGFLSEEVGELDQRCSRRVILDPIDGSRNFSLHTLGLFGVSLAVEQEGEVVAGGIALPAFGEVLLATRKSGVLSLSAFSPSVGPKRLAAGRHTKKLSEARICGGRGAAAGQVLVKRPLKVLFETANEVVNYASCSVGLAAVVKGSIDGLVLPAQSYWDFAAGKFLLERMGGEIAVFSARWLRTTNAVLAKAGPTDRFNIVACLDPALLGQIMQKLSLKSA